MRVLIEVEFRLRFSHNDWETVEEAASTSTVFGIFYADLQVAEDQQAPVRFTFFWPGEQRWEGRDFSVAIQD